MGAAGSYVTLGGDLRGSTDTLGIAVSQGANLGLPGATNEVGATASTGASTYDTMLSSNQNGTLWIESDLKGSDGSGGAYVPHVGRGLRPNCHRRAHDAT